MLPGENSYRKTKLIITVVSEKSGYLGNLQTKLFEEGAISLQDCKYSLSYSLLDVIIANKAEIVEYITDEGFTEFVRLDHVDEALVPVGANQNQVLLLMQKYLDKIEIDHELIIVDPYFYAPRPKNPDYITLLKSVLTKYIPSISQLIIVTNSKVDLGIKNNIESALQSVNPALNINSFTSDDYHDRFWISNNRTKGILVGSSLNSLGNKYALVDRLNITDVREIVNTLVTNGFI